MCRTFGFNIGPLQKNYCNRWRDRVVVLGTRYSRHSSCQDSAVAFPKYMSTYFPCFPPSNSKAHKYGSTSSAICAAVPAGE